MDQCDDWWALIDVSDVLKSETEPSVWFRWWSPVKALPAKCRCWWLWWGLPCEECSPWMWSLWQWTPWLWSSCIWTLGADTWCSCRIPTTILETISDSPRRTETAAFQMWEILSMAHPNRNLITIWKNSRHCKEIFQMCLKIVTRWSGQTSIFSIVSLLLWVFHSWQLICIFDDSYRNRCTKNPKFSI